MILKSGLSEQESFFTTFMTIFLSLILPSESSYQDQAFGVSFQPLSTESPEISSSQIQIIGLFALVLHSFLIPVYEGARSTISNSFSTTLSILLKALTFILAPLFLAATPNVEKHCFQFKVDPDTRSLRFSSPLSNLFSDF